MVTEYTICPDLSISSSLVKTELYNSTDSLNTIIPEPRFPVIVAHDTCPYKYDVWYHKENERLPPEDVGFYWGRKTHRQEKRRKRLRYQAYYQIVYKRPSPDASPAPDELGRVYDF